MDYDEIMKNNIVINEMKAQITWEDLNLGYLLSEFTYNAYSGHRSHAKKSNKLLK